MSFVFPGQASGFIPIVDTIAATTFNFSGATFGRNTRSVVGQGTTVSGLVVSDEIPYNDISNSDTAGVLNEGDNTAFSQSYAWMSPINFNLRKILLNIGFAFNVSSYDSGNPVLSAVTVNIFQITRGSQLPVITQSNSTGLTYATGFSALSATGSQVFILTDAIKVNQKISQGDFIVAQLSTTANVGGGTTTTQQGYLPAFPYQAPVFMKNFTRTTISFDGIAEEIPPYKDNFAKSNMNTPREIEEYLRRGR